jgi:putative nucleotidyltransferase with HDIG domain
MARSLPGTDGDQRQPHGSPDRGIVKRASQADVDDVPVTPETVHVPRSEEQPDHRSAGRRLLDAFDAFERFPAFAPARGQLIAGDLRIGSDAVAAVESDLALTVAVLRRANAEGPNGRVATVPEALERIGGQGLREIAAGAASFDFFESCGVWGAEPQAHRLHAVATQRAAARVARTLHYQRTDELLVAALLHDIGKLVLAHANPRYVNFPGPALMNPERRVERERREMGVDHAVVGGVLARRWGLPHELAHAIERHHAPGDAGLAGLVRLSDLIARFEAGNPVDGATIRQAATDIGLGGQALTDVLCAVPTAERRSSAPCPLTAGEHRVVSELSKGRVYKEIAAELNLSVSTVRTHLYNTYRKLGVSDRAQAILLARENGWI